MQTKTYTYQEPYFTMEVKVEGAFCAFLTVLLAWNAATNLMGLGIIFGIFALVALYQTWNTFVARCYSHSVTVGDDVISFELFGKSQSYRISELEEFQIRGGARSGKMYVRVGDHNILHGRFWVHTYAFEDGEELAERLIQIENRVDPSSLRVQARNSSAQSQSAKSAKSGKGGSRKAR